MRRSGGRTSLRHCFVADNYLDPHLVVQDSTYEMRRRPCVWLPPRLPHAADERSRSDQFNQASQSTFTKDAVEQWNGVGLASACLVWEERDGVGAREELPPKVKSDAGETFDQRVRKWIGNGSETGSLNFLQMFAEEQPTADCTELEEERTENSSTDMGHERQSTTC